MRSKKKSKPEPEAVKRYGENWQKLFSLFSREIEALTHDPNRLKLANASIRAVVFRENIAESLVYPERSHREEQEGDVISGFIALTSMISSLEECKHYFKNYPFRGKNISRSDHLRNICEMYFDRISQFRDRMKALLNAVNKVNGDKKIQIGCMLKAFDKSFKWEIRNRNYTHHHGRFNNSAIERLYLASLLRDDPSIKILIPQAEVYKAESIIWIERVERSADFLHVILDVVANYILKNVCFSFDNSE